MAWVFNLDAEDELSRGGPHTPTKVAQARVESLLPSLRALLEPGDELLWPSTEPVKSARIGRAWCPTPWACDQMRRAGLEIPPAPSPEVLRRVNHRKFAHDLGQALPAAAFVTTEAELLTLLATKPAASVEGNWLMKRPLGYAGRGRRKIASADLSAADRTWINGALRTGDGLQVEPFVVRELDCGLHGFVEADGSLKLGEPTLSSIDASGTWLFTEKASPITLLQAEREALTAAATGSAQALTAAGYFGPFGIDAFRWRDPQGEVGFQPRCELNARYSMGWAIGMN